MKKRKQNTKELPPTVLRIVRAYCADYRREEREMEKDLSEDLALSYQMNVRAMLLSAWECDFAGCHAETILADIATGCGYQNSELCGIISRKKYYAAKNKIETSIARRLNLI